MQVVVFLWGVLSVLAMLVAAVPLLGWLNWANVPFAATGLIFAGLVFATTRNDGKRHLLIAATVCCSAAVLFGIVRLIVGGGWL